MNYEAASEYMIERLRTELPKEYYYHGLSHTLDVLKATVALAAGENITDPETLILLKTAAVYHDCGFLEKYIENEPIAVRMSHEILPRFGYSKSQIDTIGRIIMTTELKATPTDLLENIMKDADFDYLGRNDYSPISMKLKKEWEVYGMKKTLMEWYELQFLFLTNHTFYTETAKKHRDPTKAKHIEEIKELLGKK
jgi:HD superfamily phosphodiesterase